MTEAQGTTIIDLLTQLHDKQVTTDHFLVLLSWLGGLCVLLLVSLFMQAFGVWLKR